MSIPTGPWMPTPHHRRALWAGLLLALLAVVFHRPDLVVLATPLLVVAGWGRLTRPSGTPRVDLRVPEGDLAEGQATGIRLVADDLDEVDTIGAELGTDPGLRVAPRGLGDAVTAQKHEAVLAVEPTRWGPTWLGTGETHLRSPWGAYDARWVRPSRVDLFVTPATGRFDADAPIPHPSGLLGTHVGRRRGEGSEFSDIREFRPGDRPRHVHWPTSARTGRLHVRTTYAENDAQIMLLVDAFGDLPGAPDGSLTRTVHAAASVAAWATRTGDRVGLRVLGATAPALAPGTGRRQLLRVLGALARLSPASDRFPVDARLQLSPAPGTLVVVVSPLTAPWLVSATAQLAARGQDVIVIDTLPEGPATTDAPTRVAARILELERDRTIAALRQRGVAVTPWRGPGTLDAVLHGLAARGVAR